MRICFKMRTSRTFIPLWGNRLPLLLPLLPDQPGQPGYQGAKTLDTEALVLVAQLIDPLACGYVARAFIVPPQSSRAPLSLRRIGVEQYNRSPGASSRESEFVSAEAFAASACLRYHISAWPSNSADPSALPAFSRSEVPTVVIIVRIRVSPRPCRPY